MKKDFLICNTVIFIVSKHAFDIRQYKAADWVPPYVYCWDSTKRYITMNSENIDYEVNICYNDLTLSQRVGSIEHGNFTNCPDDGV